MSMRHFLDFGLAGQSQKTSLPSHGHMKHSRLQELKCNAGKHFLSIRLNLALNHA